MTIFNDTENSLLIKLQIILNSFFVLTVGALYVTLFAIEFVI